MEYLIIAFRSRSSVFKLYEQLKRRGVRCEIVNTPKEAQVGCGLSVQTAYSVIGYVMNEMRRIKLSNFAGYFKVKEIGGKRMIKSI